MGVGLLLGAHVVGYGTSLTDLAVMGALTGAVLGPAQAMALPRPGTPPLGLGRRDAGPLGDRLGRHHQPPASPSSEQFTLFGASGAVTVTALLGILLHLLLPRPRRRHRRTRPRRPDGDPS